MSGARLERCLAWRRRALLGGWLLAMGVLLARALDLQVVEGSEWRARADGQHSMRSEVPAPRGAILDRDGNPLAVSRETFKVSVAPRELTDRDAARALLVDALGISASTAARVTDPNDPWAPIPGVFEPAVWETLNGVRGIYLERRLRRDHPHGDLALGVLGRVVDGVGRGGIEQAFDSILRGRSGSEMLARDSEGRPIPGQVVEIAAPVAGGDVRLSVDLDLQEIARQALEDALDTTGARGGDLLVTDPYTGEVLAMVSLQDGATAALSAINTPSEPGSTIKPFTVAAVLANHRGSLTDSIDVGNGTWTVHRRTLHDVHASGTITLADALRISSNVGVSKAAEALTPGEQYENLRDFGFGAQTGVPLPGEAAGTLAHPRAWSLQSPQSLAIGYEISVTPIQMAMAYGALANGGRLMEPLLVRAVRPPRAPERVFDPVTIRRAVSARVSRSIGRVLMDVVEDGTGTRAQLAAFRVAGKSGTARAYTPEGYASGRYYASFVGYFPAEDPQLVIFVKLDSPQGTYYGGAAAAPVTRATMEAALAARRTPLDRRALTRVTRTPEPAATSSPGVRFAALEARWEALDEGLPPPGAETQQARAVPVPVPEVRGLPPRVAVRRLHALGLRVSWDGSGAIVGTEPGAGARVMPGDTVRLRARRGRE